MSEATNVWEVAPTSAAPTSAAPPERVTFPEAVKHLPYCFGSSATCAITLCTCMSDCECKDPFKSGNTICPDCAYEAMRVSDGFMWYDEYPAEDVARSPSQPCVFKDPNYGIFDGSFTRADDKHACSICVTLWELLPGVNVHCGRHCPNVRIQVDRVRRQRSVEGATDRDVPRDNWDHRFHT